MRTITIPNTPHIALGRWLARALLTLIAVVMIAAPLTRPVAADISPNRSSAFEPVACMVALPAGAVEGKDVECGYLTVPARHSQPDGPTLKLAIAIVKHTGANAQPDPLVMLQGGPGGSGLDSYLPMALGKETSAMARIRAQRDIVIIEQRGTRHSLPALLCPEYDELGQASLEDRRLDDDHERSAAALLACRDRLTAGGVDITAFNTVENANDLTALRHALGYPQLNLYGASYGTRLALEAMRQDPAGLRSVIIDAVLPPQSRFPATTGETLDSALSALFQACAADPDCNRGYPDLERVFFEVAERLDREPARVPLVDPSNGRTHQFDLDGRRWILSAFEMLYVSPALPVFPRAIYEARAGRFALLEQVLPLLVFDRDMAWGMYKSVMCAEPSATGQSDGAVAGSRRPIVEFGRRGAEDAARGCQVWNVARLNDDIGAPVHSDIPTLVLSGALDPVTPPAFGEAAAQTLKNSRHYTFAGVGHGAFGSTLCAETMVATFVTDPAAQLNDSCATQPVRFITPSNSVFPNTGKLFGLISEPTSIEAPVITVATLGLLTFLIIWPIGAGIRALRRRPGATHRSAKLAPWAMALYTLACGLTWVALCAVLTMSVARYGGFVPQNSLPIVAAPLLFAPIVLGLLAVPVIICAVLAWRRRSWSLPARLYYSALTLQAVAVIAAYIATDMIGALIRLV